jgi:hypothetical protein
MKKNKNIAYLFAMFAVITRIIPHPYNLTSTITASVFSGVNFSRRKALCITLAGLFISDVALAIIQQHAILGSWSLFTYSGLVGITLLAKKTPHHKPVKSIVYVLGYAGLFWLWTNLGCFISMPEYPKNIVGLYTCYYNALPFLKNQLLGNLIWWTVLNYSYIAITQHRTNRQPA